MTICYGFEGASVELEGRVASVPPFLFPAPITATLFIRGRRGDESSLTTAR